MSSRATAFAVMAVLAILFSACRPAADHGEEAGELRDALRVLPGVEDVTLHYDEPEVLDPADVNLTFESEADAADVEEAAFAGAEVAIVRERVYIHVMTQEVANARHVDSLALVHLPAGTSEKARDRVRDEIAARYGELPVRVDVRVKRR